MPAVPLILFAAFAAAQQQAPAPGKARDLVVTRMESIDAPLAGKAAVPKSYAVIVGVSNYRNLAAKEQLLFTGEDAEAMYSILISREGGNFPAENVHKLTGDRATLRNIRHEIETWLPSVAKEDDRVLVYFAGHGFVHQGKVYLAPADFSRADIAGTGYSTDELGAAFGSRIKGKWKVLLTDSCHSGAVTSDTETQTINSRLKDLTRSLFSLTASRDRERSFESKDWGGGHGIFTYYVVKGLEGEADESGDGVVTADELAAYVQREVRQASTARQNPTAGGSFDNQMLLAYNPTRATRGAPPPPETGTLIFESNRDGVEVFVDGQSQGVAKKGEPLRVPGLKPGVHTVRAVHMGYEPVGPREELVYPGQESTIKLLLNVPRRRPRAAIDKFGPAVEHYQKARGPDQYKRAVTDFEEVLALDPTYSEAALYLARAHRDLHDFQSAETWFRKALDIDPDFVEARATYGGMLFDKGDTDEAIRQLNQVLRRDRGHALAYYLLSQAYRIKEQYGEAVDSARQAVRLTPANAEAHFWLAEGLRGQTQWAAAAAEYRQYLQLSNFDSSAVEKFGYYAIGFKFFRKSRAGTQDVWRELRNLAYFGLCDCEQRQQRFEAAVAFCQKALAFDPKDPLTHYALALSYMKQADAEGDLGLLVAARKHFSQMIALNADLDESARARKNISVIDHYMATR